jgi:hypothetical protein
MMLKGNFEESLPRRFTRLHLMDTAGARAMRVPADCMQWKCNFTCLMLQREAAGDAQDSAFAAIIEPYQGEPFVRATRLLAIPQNQHDAECAVAVEVKLAQGQTDVCFADARPQQLRRVPEAGLSVAGEFACYSTDVTGLRLAVLAGGTKLPTLPVRLSPFSPAMEAGLPGTCSWECLPSLGRLGSSRWVPSAPAQIGVVMEPLRTAVQKPLP